MTAQAPREAFASLGRMSWTRVVTIAAAGLLLRVVVRLYSGEADFWQNGYSFLFELAHNVAAGHGLAFDAQPPTAYRVPMYPLFLALVTLGHRAFLPIVLAQSLVGAATVLCAGLLAADRL